MHLIVIRKDSEPLHRTVTRSNYRKVAKSIYAFYPDSNYPILEAIIWNSLQKGLEEFTIYDGFHEVKDK